MFNISKEQDCIASGLNAIDDCTKHSAQWVESDLNTSEQETDIGKVITTYTRCFSEIAQFGAGDDIIDDILRDVKSVLRMLEILE